MAKQLSVLILFLLLVNHSHAASSSSWSNLVDGMNTSIDPGNDFFGYVNGAWAANAQIPPDKARHGAFEILRDLSEERVKAIVEDWVVDDNLDPSSDAYKVASIYRTFLNEEAIEKLDAQPIHQELEAIRQVTTHAEMATLMGRAHYGFFGAFFYAFVSPDEKDSDKYALKLAQSGLNLPDRDYYLRDSFREKQVRYQLYLERMLTLIEWDDPASNAANIVAMQTDIAQAHWTKAESRDRSKTYNPIKMAELRDLSPEFPWTQFFEGARIGHANNIILRQNTAILKLAEIFINTPLPTLKAWAAFNVVENSASYLSSRFADEKWEFRERFLRGAEQKRPRWKQGVEVAENLMGEAIGRAYVERHFPLESKEKMDALVRDLQSAFKIRIENLHWMTQATKEQALKKLSMFRVKIGYPSKWRDYTPLVIQEGDLIGNINRSSEQEWQREIERIDMAVDRDEWHMTPQTVNAYYQPNFNEIVFPAAILEPPFFDPHGDAAVNYGAIGGIIGHEITHGFDDQGRKMDGAGLLSDWWTDGDEVLFKEEASKLGAQYEVLDLPGIPDLHINPQLTMGENIADLGGILCGLDAYKIALGESSAEVIDGFTGVQRVFLGWAYAWRTVTRMDTRRMLLVSDPHAPAEVRAFAPLRNVDEWYEAFDVQESDALFIKPEDRVKIW